MPCWGHGGASQKTWQISGLLPLFWGQEKINKRRLPQVFGQKKTSVSQQLLTCFSDCPMGCEEKKILKRVVFWYTKFPKIYNIQKIHDSLIIISSYRFPNNLNLATKKTCLPPLAADVSHRWWLTVSNLGSGGQSRTVELVETKEITELK